jgi:hypothetical protein
MPWARGSWTRKLIVCFLTFNYVVSIHLTRLLWQLHHLRPRWHTHRMFHLLLHHRLLMSLFLYKSTTSRIMMVSLLIITPEVVKLLILFLEDPFQRLVMLALILRVQVGFARSYGVAILILEGRTCSTSIDK